MQPYTIFLHGREFRGALPGALVRDVFDVLDDGARGAVRLRLEGRSRAGGGSPPGWVNDAASFELVRVLPDAPGLELRAPTFAESLPERFAQADLFPAVSPGETALSVLGASLCDALAGDADSDAFDEPLLGTFEEFRRVFRHGVASIEIRNGRRGATPVVVTSGGLQTVQRLKRETPRPQRVRVAGTLDEIRHSDRGFTLMLTSGEAIRGVLVEGDPAVLATHFGRPAVIEGMAQFRPSGAPLRIDADLIEDADERDIQIWSKRPKSLWAPLDPRELEPRRPGGIAAIVGMWPGDETDDEIFAMIEEMS
jgi:hypothetical protein